MEVRPEVAPLGHVQQEKSRALCGIFQCLLKGEKIYKVGSASQGKSDGSGSFQLLCCFQRDPYFSVADESH